MKTEARIFLSVAVFCWIAAIGYGIWTGLPNSFSHGQVEPVGVAALILSGGLLGIPGGFFYFVGVASTRARKIAATPRSPRPPATSASSAPAATGPRVWPGPRPCVASGWPSSRSGC